MQTDIVVELADGVYPLAAPLTFATADSGTSGHTITWQGSDRCSPGAVRSRTGHWLVSH